MDTGYLLGMIVSLVVSVILLSSALRQANKTANDIENRMRLLMQAPHLGYNSKREPYCLHCSGHAEKGERVGHDMDCPYKSAELYLTGLMSKRWIKVCRRMTP